MSLSTRNLLPHAPSRGKGVRRLSSLPVYLFFGAFVLVAIVVGYTFHLRVEQSKTQKAAEDTGKASGAGDHASQMFGQDTKDTQKKPAAPPPTPASPKKQPEAQQAPAGTISVEEAMRRAAWASYMQRSQQEMDKQADNSTKALTEDTQVSLSGGGGQPGADGIMTAGAMSAGTPGMPGGGSGNPQAEKRAFLGQGGDVYGLNENLQGSVHGPKPNTIMEGTAIPGVMVGGLNSDMPGMLVGQIAQNVCDSETGNNLLIPWGSKVVGIYDNSVSQGQRRVGVIWNRIIFPDTSSRQIGSMEGADQGGYAGFHDIVDTHFWEKLWSSVLVSIGGAAVQLAQPPPAANGFYSPWSTGTGALTQQANQVTQEYARAGLSIPNTLEVRPGYNFVLMANKDMPLPVYHGMSCDGASSQEATSRPINLGPILQ